MPTATLAQHPVRPAATQLSVRIDPSGEEPAELQRRLDACDLVARYLIDLQRDAA